MALKRHTGRSLALACALLAALLVAPAAWADDGAGTAAQPAPAESSPDTGDVTVRPPAQGTAPSSTATAQPAQTPSGTETPGKWGSTSDGQTSSTVLGGSPTPTGQTGPVSSGTGDGQSTVTIELPGDGGTTGATPRASAPPEPRDWAAPPPMRVVTRAAPAPKPAGKAAPARAAAPARSVLVPAPAPSLSAAGAELLHTAVLTTARHAAKAASGGAGSPSRSLPSQPLPPQAPTGPDAPHGFGMAPGGASGASGGITVLAVLAGLFAISLPRLGRRVSLRLLPQQSLRLVALDARPG